MAEERREEAQEQVPDTRQVQLGDEQVQEAAQQPESEEPPPPQDDPNTDVIKNVGN